MARRIRALRRGFRPKPVAVIDTNVFVEIHSCYDVATAIDTLVPTLGDEAMRDPSVTVRIARARESLLLALYLDRAGLSTYSLRGEAIRKLAEFSPTDGSTFASAFTIAFVYFVADHLLCGWKSQVSTVAETVTQDEADLLLIEYAKKHDLPVITHEGYTQRGIRTNNKRTNMRARCADAGVKVFAPREYYEGRIDEAAEVAAFFERFRERAPVWLLKRAQQRMREGKSEDAMGQVLDYVYGLYRMVLEGAVSFQDHPIPTKLF